MTQTMTQTTTQTTTAASGQLRRQLTDAWNDGDAVRYAAAFTEDADHSTFLGLRIHSRQEIEDGHRHLFRPSIKLDSGAAGQAEVKPLAGGVARGIVAGGCAVNGETDPAHNSVITLMTGVDTRNGWRLASFHNTRVSDPRA